jgi:hypothetical protein
MKIVERYNEVFLGGLERGFYRSVYCGVLVLVFQSPYI